MKVIFFSFGVTGVSLLLILVIIFAHGQMYLPAFKSILSL